MVASAVAREGNSLCLSLSLVITLTGLDNEVDGVDGGETRHDKQTGKRSRRLGRLRAPAGVSAKRNKERKVAKRARAANPVQKSLKRVLVSRLRLTSC